MKNYVTVLDRKDKTSVTSFQKALALTLKGEAKNNNMFLATLRGNEVIVNDWTGDEINLVNTVISFYGTITHINVTTNKVYTAITPYILSEKVNDFIIVVTPSHITLESSYSLTDFKSRVTEVHKAVSLIQLYERNTSISVNKEKYMEVLNVTVSAIKSSPSPLKGVVSVTIHPKEVQISFVTDIERLVSSLFSLSPDEGINIEYSSPLGIISRQGETFNNFMFGLKSTSNENYGNSSSLTVSEFLQLYNTGDIIPLATENVTSERTQHIITLFNKLAKESTDVRVSSNPLE